MIHKRFPFENFTASGNKNNGSKFKLTNNSKANLHLHVFKVLLLWRYVRLTLSCRSIRSGPGRWSSLSLVALDDCILGEVEAVLVTELLVIESESLAITPSVVTATTDDVTTLECSRASKNSESSSSSFMTTVDKRPPSVESKVMAWVDVTLSVSNSFTDEALEVPSELALPNCIGFPGNGMLYSPSNPGGCGLRSPMDIPLAEPLLFSWQRASRPCISLAKVSMFSCSCTLRERSCCTARCHRRSVLWASTINSPAFCNDHMRSHDADNTISLIQMMSQK